MTKAEHLRHTGCKDKLMPPTPLDDKLIRAALRKRLQSKYSRAKNVRIVDEIGLHFGAARLDLAVINGTIQGYEIKSDRDNLKRLENQVARYAGPLDRLTIVAGWRHVLPIIRSAPNWWGIVLAERGGPNTVRLATLREATDNPAPDSRSLTWLLWKSELLDALKEFEEPSMSSAPKRELQGRLLALVSSHSELRKIVCTKLRQRKNWRSDVP